MKTFGRFLSLAVLWSLLLTAVNPAGAQQQQDKVGLALFCPITSNVKGDPFEVVLPEKHKVSGVILSDQIKSLDWRVRKAKRMACAPRDVHEEVLAKILTLLDFNP